MDLGGDVFGMKIVGIGIDALSAQTFLLFAALLDLFFRVVWHNLSFKKGFYTPEVAVP
jgi:hypothetical protein